MEIFFKVLAVVLIGTAAVLFWQSEREYAFGAAVLSACAYFLSLRFQLKARVRAREAEKEAQEDSPDRFGD